MSEPVKCWTDQWGNPWTFRRYDRDCRPAIAVPLDLLERLVSDAEAAYAIAMKVGADPYSFALEHYQLQTMIREMRQEAPDE
jgi:hypothetical protein